jgi:hypothetical protein
LLEARGRATDAERCYRRAAADIGASHRCREQALHALACLLRRARRFREAASVWREIVSLGVGRTPAVREAIEALAVHHEHRDRDLEQARALATRALHTERDPRRRDAIRYRLARIDRKLGHRASTEVQPGFLVPE